MNNDINEILSYEELKGNYLKNPKKFKELLNNKPDFGFKKIGDINFVNSNENFDKLKNFCFNNCSTSFSLLGKKSIKIF